MSDMFSHKFVCDRCLKIVESDKVSSMCIQCEDAEEKEKQAIESCSLPDTDHKIPMPPVKPCLEEPDNSHYKHGSIDPLQYVEAMGDVEYRGACILNIVKYITRYPHKGTPLEDLAKAQDYLSKLIEHERAK